MTLFLCDFSQMTRWNRSPRSPNRAGAMADSKQVAAKHQQSLQFVSEGCCIFCNNLHPVARVVVFVWFYELFDVLIILRFSLLHFVPANSIQCSCAVLKVETQCRKSRRLSIGVAWRCSCAWGQKQLEEVERTMLSLLIPDEVLSLMPSLLSHRSTDWCSGFL